jgi:hypothetical protein
VNKKALDRFKISPSGELLGSFNESHPEWEIYPTVDDAPYRVGDRLWVKESWKPGAWRNDGRVAIDYMASPELTHTPWAYMEDQANKYIPRWLNEISDIGLIPNQDGRYEWEPGKSPFKWKRAMYMPRFASRITLEITDIRVERVQDICWDDCIREGICSLTLPEDLGNQELYEWLEKKSAPRPLIKSIEDLRESYRVAWNDLNAKRGYPWESNPWVWVIEFKRVGNPND